MSNHIGKLPPPWPNAALTLTKVAGELQVRENVERVTDTSPEARSARRAAKVDSGEQSGNEPNKTGKNGVDVSV